MHRTSTRAGLRARLSVLLGALALSFTLSGCGATGPGMAQVSGKVTSKGQPVNSGNVSFITTDPKGRNATGQIGDGGSFRLQTENPGDGAILGEYNVTITAREEVILDYIPKKPVPPKYLVPAKYENPATSGLKFTVKSGSNTANFDLTD